MTERPWCEKRVFGYNRLIGGELCGNRAKAQYNGKWFCGVHSPEAVAKRAAKREEHYQEHVRQSNVRAESHNYRSACVRAFHDPAGRTIATEDIAEGLVFQMRDLMETWYRLCTNPQISAETYWREHPKLIARMEALLSSLKVQGPEK